jgi:thiamine-monophosphate kinase
MKLSKLGEFGLIRQIGKICIEQSRDILLNIGDDAAAVKTGTKTTLLSSDMLAEGVHFDLKTTSFRQLGHKILAVNLSDIYAMGGRPRFFLLNIAIPDKCDVNNIREIYRGIRKLASEHGVKVIGGDTTASKYGLVLSGTMVGEADRVISRKGAKPGDSIFVSGTLGDSAMGLEILKKTRHKKRETGTSRFSLPGSQLKLCKRHLMPEPMTIKRTKDITSMIDISDGLLADLGHICDESRVGAMIYSNRIPLSKELITVSKPSGKDPLEYALKGGEDFVLLFTSPAKSRRDAVRIGEIIKKGRYLADPMGRKRRFKAEGYEHFKKIDQKSKIKDQR